MSAVARWFRVDVRTVQNWKNNGMPVADGGYSLQGITEWRLARSDARASTVDTDIEAAELRDKIAVADTREFNLAVKRGQYVRRDIIESEERQKAARARARMQAAPGELAAIIPPEIRTDILIVVENFFDNLLRDISECYASATKEPTKPKKSGGRSQKNGSRERSRKASRGRKSGS